MFGGEKGSYQVGLKLFGVIKLKDIQVDVVDTRYAVPCGSPIGIYLKSDGVMVIGTATPCPATWIPPERTAWTRPLRRA